MRPTYDIVLAMVESVPGIHEAMWRKYGCTVPQAVRGFFEELAQQPTAAARDALFSDVLAHYGCFTNGMANFDRGSEQMLERLESRDTRQDVIRQLSEQSKRTSVYVSPERLNHIAEHMLTGRLTQGLNDRMRARDEHIERRNPIDRTVNAAQRRDADDRNDIRAGLNAGFAEAAPARERPRSYEYLKPGDTASIRQALELATDIDEIRNEDIDPLEDEALRRSTNAV